MIPAFASSLHDEFVDQLSRLLDDIHPSLLFGAELITRSLHRKKLQFLIVVISNIRFRDPELCPRRLRCYHSYELVSIHVLVILSLLTGTAVLVMPHLMFQSN